MLRTVPRALLVALLTLTGVALLEGGAHAVSVSRAELKGGQLRLDGTGAAPGVYVMVTSTTGVAGVRSDLTGAYHVLASGFRADDCTVVVSDRQTHVATVPLSGCTPTPATPPAAGEPTGACVVNPAAPASYTLGDQHTFYVTTTGCDTSGGPLRWEFVAGRVPVGMTGPSTQGYDATAVDGRPTTLGTSTFQLRATDSSGASDTENFTITVTAPRPVAVTTTSLPPATVGTSLQDVLRADGGLPGYDWTLSAGALPAGLRLTSGGSIAGTPTARGTATFTVRATDSRGVAGTHAYSLTVG